MFGLRFPPVDASSVELHPANHQVRWICERLKFTSGDTLRYIWWGFALNEIKKGTIESKTQFAANTILARPPTSFSNSILFHPIHSYQTTTVKYLSAT